MSHDSSFVSCLRCSCCVCSLFLQRSFFELPSIALPFVCSAFRGVPCGTVLHSASRGSSSSAQYDAALPRHESDRSSVAARGARQYGFRSATALHVCCSAEAHDPSMMLSTVQYIQYRKKSLKGACVRGLCLRPVSQCAASHGWPQHQHKAQNSTAQRGTIQFSTAC